MDQSYGAIQGEERGKQNGHVGDVQSPTSHITDSGSEDELYTEITREDDGLLKTNRSGPDENKVSGRAWGRVKNIFTRRKNYPGSVFFILGNEFCERFSYYGMRAILVIYLTRWLNFTDDHATAIYHSFSMLCYFMPLFGAVLADGYLGRYRTILYLSIVYAIGNLVMSLTALPPAEWIGPIIGLVLIGVGTGGIKPCVVAFGADQFSPEQEKERATFFSVFYFMINLGSMFSILLTPVLRGDVQCFGHGCYPLAFGVPALLMFTSLVVFVCGRSMYKRSPPTGNLVGRVSKCIMLGIRGKIRSCRSGIKFPHWLDYAEEEFEPEFVGEVKLLLRVLFLFLPLPLFWALSDQQGVLPRLKPDQLQALNPLLIILLIPVFERCIYPLLERCNILKRPLQRMVLGMFLTAAAFVVAALVQISIESGLEPSLTSTESGITFINAYKCDVKVKSDLYTHKLLFTQSSDFLRKPPGAYNISLECDGKTYQQEFHFSAKTAYRQIIQADNGTMFMYQAKDVREKSKKGDALVSTLFAPKLDDIVKIKLVSQSHKGPIKSDTGYDFNVSYTGVSNYVKLQPGMYKVYTAVKGSPTSWTVSRTGIEMGQGAVYTLLLYNSTDTKMLDLSIYKSVEVNHMSIFWMVPQYVIITVGEILFSVTGLGFAYSESPKSMKSVVQAAWLMTTAVGDLIVVIVASSRIIPNQVGEFFFFAGLMSLVTVLFMIMAIYYKYHTPTQVNLQNSQQIDDLADLIEGEVNTSEELPLKHYKQNES